MSGYEPIKFIMFIVNRGEGKRIQEFCSTEGLYGHLLLRGRGTADNETLALLGIGEREKDVFIVTAAASRAASVMERIAELLHFDKPGTGIGFSIPFTSLALQLNSYYAMAGLPDPDSAGGGGETDNRRKKTIGRKKVKGEKRNDKA